LEERARGFDEQRRKMHNLIQELRGNVRVFARVRPFLPSDGVDLATQPNPSSSVAVRPDDMTLRISRTASGSDRAEEHSFSFDRTFGASASQEVVFKEVSEFVQSALDGYNVCLFSYGQTGSGKTHTMSGSGKGSMRGIIPRAIEQVGAYKTALEAKGWEYHMEVSYIEIYNETIRDLLRNGPDEDGKHEIKRDLAGNTTVTDVIVTPVDPNNGDQMDAIMEQAARNRSVEKTAMNERSSRSHSVFTLHLRATNAAEGASLRGTLSLVDLAGSERLDRSGATGARMKETVAINKSLSSLVDVFAAISNKQQHVPFRNSKLTYLLQPALSGDGKTLMLVNLSPTEESYFESLCSLRFASHVNQCELSHYGKPKKQVNATESSTPGGAANHSSKAGTSGTNAGSSSKGFMQPTASAAVPKPATSKK
jgi:kinesin family protein C1